MKVLQIKIQTDKLNEIVNKLVRMKSSINHPNILKDPRIQNYHSKAKGHLFLFLIMEEGVMSLEAYLSAHPEGFPEEELCQVMDSFASAVSHISDKKIAYCDIKPLNIILF